MFLQSEAVQNAWRELRGAEEEAESGGERRGGQLDRFRHVVPVTVTQQSFYIDFGGEEEVGEEPVEEVRGVAGGVGDAWRPSSELLRWEVGSDGSPLVHSVFLAAETVPGLRRLRDESLLLSPANASNTLALTAWALPVDGLLDAARDTTRLHLGVVRMRGSAAPTVRLTGIPEGAPLVFSLPYYGAMALLRDEEAMTPATATALVAALLTTYGFTDTEVDAYLAHWREGDSTVLPIPTAVVRTAQARLATLYAGEASRARPNLAALIAAKPSIPVPDYVTAMLAEIDVLLEHEANATGVEAKFLAARAAARLARRIAEDEGTIGALYYPDEHRATIYLPLFLPLMLTLFRMGREEWREYREARQASKEKSA